MRQTLNGMRKRGSEDRGFTMIELLVVVVIIGVLVAIAVPVYLNYRKGAANKSAASDVRGAITAIEQYYTDNNQTYPAGQIVSDEGKSKELPAGTDGTPQVMTVSPGNVLGYQNTTPTGGGTASYRLCARNKDGGQMYVYNSTSGGSVSKTTGTDVAACLTAT